MWQWPAKNNGVVRRDDLAAGDRVVITSWSLRGQQGVLIRPARLITGKAAWLVQLDDRKHPAVFRGRARVGERSLQRLDGG